MTCTECFSHLLLEDDPPLPLLEVSLGSRHLRARDFVAARPYLESAMRYYRNCQPPDPLRLTQVANWCSEMERAEGSLVKAQSYLDEASRLYERIANKPLGLYIRLNQGRLAAASGNYAAAFQKFDEVIAGGSALPVSASI